VVAAREVLVDSSDQKKCFYGEFIGFLKICLKFLFGNEKLPRRRIFCVIDGADLSSAERFIHKQGFISDHCARHS